MIICVTTTMDYRPTCPCIVVPVYCWTWLEGTPPIASIPQTSTVPQPVKAPNWDYFGYKAILPQLLSQVAIVIFIVAQSRKYQGATRYTRPVVQVTM